jgi:hypothetical protein
LKLHQKNWLCLIVFHPKRRTTKMNSELAHMKTSDLGRHPKGWWGVVDVRGLAQRVKGRRATQLAKPQ